MRGRIQDRMPYFKNISLGYCDVIICPKRPYLQKAAIRKRYKTVDEYRINANYYNQWSFWFEILIKNNKNDSDFCDLNWEFMRNGEILSSF